MVLHLKMIKGIFPHAYRFLCKIEHLHALTNPSVKQILAWTLLHLLYIYARMFKSTGDVLFSL